MMTKRKGMTLVFFQAICLASSLMSMHEDPCHPLVRRAISWFENIIGLTDDSDQDSCTEAENNVCKKIEAVLQSTLYDYELFITLQMKLAQVKAHLKAVGEKMSSAKPGIYACTGEGLELCVSRYGSNTGNAAIASPWGNFTIWHYRKISPDRRSAILNSVKVEYPTEDHIIWLNPYRKELELPVVTAHIKNQRKAFKELKKIYASSGEYARDKMHLELQNHDKHFPKMITSLIVAYLYPIQI